MGNRENETLSRMAPGGHGGDVYGKHIRIDFSTSISPLGIPDTVRQAYLAAAGSLSQYPDVSCGKLRAALSDRFRVPAERIVCGNGAAELIFAAASALRPRRALLTAPGFSEYERGLLAAGCRDIDIYRCRREDGFRIRPDILDRITEDTDLFFLCNPQSPAGLLTDQDLLEEISACCRAHHVLLVLDECYMGLLPDPERHSLKRHLRQEGGAEHLFIIDAFTKTFAMPGLRLGFGMTGSRALTDRIRAQLQPWSVSVPAQAAGCAALKDEAYLKEARSAIREEMAFLTEGLEKRGVWHTDSDANFVLFEAPEDFGQICLEHGVLVRDCSSFRGLETGTRKSAGTSEDGRQFSQRQRYYRAAARSTGEEEELLQVLDAVLCPV